MKREEIKNWSKEKVKGKRWSILLPMIIIWALSSGISVSLQSDDFKPSTMFLILIVQIVAYIVIYIIQTGFISFMINFISDKEYKIEQLFSKFNDWARITGVGILQSIYIFLWTLLFIIPGIVKSLAYSLSQYLLVDDKYKDLSSSEIIKKSSELMQGHKWDLFVLNLSFIGWHILAIFTLGILEIWIMPYQQTALTKFYYEIKEQA